MIRIKTGSTYIMKSVEENANGDIKIVSPDDHIYNLIPKQQMRQEFSADLLDVIVYDALLDVHYLSKTNELEDGTAVISNVDAQTDRDAVAAYLSVFIGKI